MTQCSSKYNLKFLQKKQSCLLLTLHWTRGWHRLNLKRKKSLCKTTCSLNRFSLHTLYDLQTRKTDICWLSAKLYMYIYQKRFKLFFSIVIPVYITEFFFILVSFAFYLTIANLSTLHIKEVYTPPPFAY